MFELNVRNEIYPAIYDNTPTKPLSLCMKSIFMRNLNRQVVNCENTITNATENLFVPISNNTIYIFNKSQDKIKLDCNNKESNIIPIAAVVEFANCSITNGYVTCTATKEGEIRINTNGTDIFMFPICFVCLMQEITTKVTIGF